jgi:hypothetical protein
MSRTDFWSSVMGSLEFTFEWWLAVKYLDGADWDKPGTVQLTIDDGEGKPLTKKLTTDHLVSAYKYVIDKEYTHCGTNVDIDDMDECSSDMVLQVAMLGDVVYG